jgi:hypothetical protein
MKVCTKCLTEKTIEAFNKNAGKKDGLQTWCKDCKSNRKRELLKEGLCIDSCGRSISTSVRCRQCADKANMGKVKKKKEALVYYGNKCECCGEEAYEFLTFEHKNGDGAQHRRDNKLGSGRDFAYWLKKNNYPAFIGILCWNCNAAKGFFGYCPHQPKKEAYNYVN